MGLEHFGFVVDNLKAMVEHLQTDGVRIVQSFTDVPGKTRLAYIEGPDGVLIELNFKAVDETGEVPVIPEAHAFI